MSGIYRQSKVGLLQKLCSEHTDLERVFAEVMSLDAIQEEVVDAWLMLFRYIYGDINKSLQNHRLNRYHKMTATNTIKTERFNSTELVETDPQKLVSFSTGEIYMDETVNCYLSNDVGMKMQESIDGGNFTSKISLKLKCNNVDIFKNV